MTYDSLKSATGAEVLYTAFFEALTGNSLLLKTDAPHFTILAATPAFLKQTNTLKEVLIGKGLFEAFPEQTAAPDHSGQRNISDSLQYVLQHKAVHHLPVQRYDLKNEDGSFTEKYWKACNTPVLTPEGEVSYIIHTAEDITSQVQSTQKTKLDKGIEQAYNLFMQTPISIHMIKGYELIIDMANAPTLQYWGRGTEVIGKPLMEALPELEGQGYDNFLREVLRTGETKEFYEAPVTLHRNGQKEVGYFNFIYKPYFEEGKEEAIGIVTVSTEVTDKVLAKKQIMESEAKYRTLFDTMDQGFCVFEMIFDENKKPVNYRFLETNPVFAQQTGLQEAVGKTIKELVPNIESHWIERYGNVALTGEPIRFTEGSEVMGRWYDVYAFPVGDANNRNVALLFTDISGRKKAEEAIKQSENNLRLIIQQAPIAISIFKGPQYHLEIVNPQMAEMLGRSIKEVEGLPLFEAMPEVRNIGLEEILEGVMASGKTFISPEQSFQLPRQSGLETIWIKYIYEPIKNEAGTVERIMVLAIDVTQQVMARHKIEDIVKQRTLELAHANEALIESNKDLSRSNQNLEEFAYAASHDLKEPIRKIHFFTDRLKGRLKDKLEEQDKHYFERLETGAKRMSTLIDDLLMYSHINRGASHLEVVDLSSILSLVEEDLELAIKDKNAKITINKLPVIRGHKRQLQQLFENLIGNALKYCKPGVTPLIEITCKQLKGDDALLNLKVEVREKDFYLVEVKDNGIGFNQDDAERIFNVFTRLHGNSEYKGTGVGLSIVRKIAQNHNGYVWAESKPEEGSTFKILLPVNN